MVPHYLLAQNYAVNAPEGSPYDRYGMRWLKFQLGRWGEWIERHRLDHSGPKSWATGNIPGSHSSGHRILCAQMPYSLWILNLKVHFLPSSDRLVIDAWYGYSFDYAGRTITARMKAEALGMDLNLLRVKEHRARRRLLALL